MSRIAVVAFNLGGPDSPEAVRPFLENLFSDPMILRVPGVFRRTLASLISRCRAPAARANYEKIGGRSPILSETRKQAAALQNALSGEKETYRVFVAMRYWHPFAEETVAEVVRWDPDRILLLPLYPQFSTATTGSFLRAWKRAAQGNDFDTHFICCWPDLDGFVRSVASGVASALQRLPAGIRFRVLFSAHGLPQRFVDDGDPYETQIRRSAEAVAGKLKLRGSDYAICYQSRVGRMEWLRPYTEDEIRRAGAEGVALVVVPIAFVSEHLETLVELDVDYAELAASFGAPAYERVQTVGDDPDFIADLAELIRRTDSTGPAGRACNPASSECPCWGKAG